MSKTEHTRRAVIGGALAGAGIAGAGLGPSLAQNMPGNAAGNGGADPSPKLKIIAVEEHFNDPELQATWPVPTGRVNQDAAARVDDLGARRIAEMDAAGIDMQVISHGSPSTQLLEPARAITIARDVNNHLAAAVKAHPTRFAGFAVLPTSAPEAAADELERAVTQLGLKGAMINGQSQGAFIDTPNFWPIYARAEQLGVPIYLHPANPNPAVIDAYYKDYAADYPVVIMAAWGFTLETGTQAVRLVLSGLFDKHPNVQFILGHMGETVPFMMWRINEGLQRPGQKSVNFRQVFTHNFSVTTSAFFSDTALNDVIAEVGIERVMFAVDWPYADNKRGADWLRALKMSDADKAAIAHGNAERLLKL